MLSVNLDKSLVFVIVRFYFLNLFPFNFVFSRGGQGPPWNSQGGARGLLPPPMYATVYMQAGIEGGGYMKIYVQAGIEGGGVYEDMRASRD